MAVEAKPFFTGILVEGSTDVYECPADTRAIVAVIRLKNKAGVAATIAVNANWDGANDIEQFPENYEVQPGQIASDINFRLILDEGDKLKILVGAGGEFHCYVGGIEQPK